MSRRLYAQGTSVPVNRSRDECERLVDSIGATDVATLRSGAEYVFAFKLGNMPFVYRVEAVEDDPAETRRRWRVLALRIKHRVTLVREAGESVEEAFMPHAQLRDGRTVLEHVGPAIAQGESPLPYATVIETARRAAVDVRGRHLVTADGHVRPAQMERLINRMRAKLTSAGVLATRGPGGHRRAARWSLVR